MSRVRPVLILVCIFALQVLPSIAWGMQKEGAGGERPVAGTRAVTAPEPLTMAAVVGGALVVGGVVYGVRRRER